jgi:tetratricopeptide (TPR) repeat protein
VAPEDDEPAAGLPPISMLQTERTLGKIQRLLAEGGVETAEEANAFLKKLGPGFFNEEEQPSDEPIERARQLAYDAMDAPNEREARKLIGEALALDPDCVEAIVMLAEMSSSEAEDMELAERAVAAGERRLGKTFFKENRGHFWGILETRPYMRARHHVAMLLMGRGRVAEAIGHFEEMIELCPNDNMGVREQLLPLYLMVDHVEAAAKLLARYEDDIGPTMTWGGALVFYILRDFDKARKSLAAARRWKPRVEKYLTLKKKLPKRKAGDYFAGSEEEAVEAATFLQPAWQLHPTALAWLEHGGRPGDGKYFGIATGLKPRG